MILLLLALAGGVAWALYATRPRVQSKPAADVRPVVRTLTARKVPVRRQWRGQGTVEALRSADVPARVTATVIERVDGVRSGTAVTLGQPLVRLDAEDFVRQAEAARQRIAEMDASLAQLDVEFARLTERLALEDADVSMARTEFNRQTRLEERGVTTEQDVDSSRRTLITSQRSQLGTRQAADLIGPRRRQLEAQKAGQQAQLNLAELERARTVIVSPLTGVVQTLDVEVGESVTAGQRVARVVAIDRVEVPVALPAVAGTAVAVGDRMTLRASGAGSGKTGAPGNLWEARVTRVAPEYDRATRTITVFAELKAGAGEPAPPPPGMFVEARVEVHQSEPRWVVPRGALREQRLQVVVDGVLVSRSAPVDFYLSGPQPELDLDDDQWAVLGEGALRPGQQVVVDGASRFPDGTAVETRDAEAAATPVGPPRPADEPVTEPATDPGGAG